MWLETALVHCQQVTGAGNGTRTRDVQLGKLMLYQLSYSRKWQTDRIQERTIPGARSDHGTKIGVDHAPSTMLG